MGAEPPGQRPATYPPADARRRALGRLADLALPIALLLMGPRANAPVAFALFGAALLLCGDSLFGPGRSLGKRLFGLRTIQLATRRPAPTVAGMKRNALFALALLPAAFTAGPLGRYEALGTLAVVLALESIFALRPLARDVGQRRIGDIWAGTQVIDASIALQLPAPAPVRPERAFVQPPAVRQEKPAARQGSEACA